MISLSAIKPHWLLRLDFEFDGFECNETSGVLGDVGRLESGENSVRKGFAGVIGRRFDKGVVFSEEVHLNPIPRISFDVRGGIGETVFADFDDVGDGIMNVSSFKA
jgi:hypothetical protein